MTTVSPVIVHVDVRTRNELNASRMHWRLRRGWRADVKSAVGWSLLGANWGGMPKPSAETPWEVLLVRLGPVAMDDDGVVSALKSVRDAVALFVGVDDRRRDLVRYSYDQERQKEHGVRIEARLRGDA